MITRGPDLLGTASAIQRHPRADRAQLVAFQDAKLRRLLAHAYEYVPYYRKLFDRHRLPLLGPGVEFLVRIVDDIPLDAGGKFRHARSLMASTYEQAAPPPAHG